MMPDLPAVFVFGAPTLIAGDRNNRATMEQLLSTRWW
jgi:hypothetical protein